MKKKYKLTGEKHPKNPKLRRIVALRDFADVKKGDKGGWLESEKNLSQKDNCWVFDNALVSGNALVFGDARVSGNARVFGNARVSGNAWVYDNARVSGDARVSRNARVSGDALIC